MKVYTRRNVACTAGKSKEIESCKGKEAKHTKAQAAKDQSSATSEALATSQITDREEALRLKIIAEEEYTSNNLKSALKYVERAINLDPSLEGLLEMLTAFKILCTADKPNFPSTAESSYSSQPDYYRILQLEDFSHINIIKKQYKKLALTLHPDKNPFAACEEAFKLVGEANRVLSDRIRKKEYDMRLRIVIQSQEATVEVCAEMFWTACSTCKSLHQFERKYLEHSLICPVCKKCFKAMKVEKNTKKVEPAEFVKEVEVVPTRTSARIQEKASKGKTLDVLDKYNLGVKQDISRVGEGLDMSGVELARHEDGNGVAVKGLRSKRVEDVGNPGVNASGSMEKLTSKRPGKASSDESGSLRSPNEVAAQISRLRKVRMEVRNEVEDGTMNAGLATDVSERAKRAKVREEATMTLSQMQMLVKQKNVGGDKLNLVKETSNNEKSPNKEKVGEKEVGSTTGNGKKVKRKENEGEKELAKGCMMEKENNKRRQSMREKGEIDMLRASEGSVNTEIDMLRACEGSVNAEVDMLRASRNGDLVIMPVEDSDFHDFDSDRRERSFKKGQVWAAYDDDDAMPRYYALIDDVSMNPFEVTLNWLEFQCNGDQELMHRQKMGFPLSCGKFKVSRKISVKYLNLFSHLVNNERVARDTYMIYPKKGTVWALYLLNDLNTGERNRVPDKRSYNIIVALNGFSFSHGLSIAVLQKVDGFRSVYKRREIGVNAVQFLGKDDIKLLSHQIPAKKLSGAEAPHLPKDCWELDPASIAPQSYVGSS